MGSKPRPYWRYIYRTMVIWIGEAVGLLLLIYLIPGLSVNSVYDPDNDEVAALNHKFCTGENTYQGRQIVV